MDEFSIFIIVVALGFHLGLTILIIAYICYKDCTCPKFRKNISEEELEQTVQNDVESPPEQTQSDESESRTGSSGVNVYFTHRWVSSLTNRIQAYASRRRTRDPESTPTVVITGSIDSDDDDLCLPCYNEALALEINSTKSSVIHLDSPPSYDDIFSKIQQTQL